MSMTLPSLLSRGRVPRMSEMASELGSPSAAERGGRAYWEEAEALLEATVTARRRQDHRAHLASLIGIYEDEGGEGIAGAGCSAAVLFAAQPDRIGRKIIFLDGVSGELLGHIALEGGPSTPDETAPGETAPAFSSLRGMLVTEASRGRGHSRLFLAVWLRLCLLAGVSPSTSRINKPLLALTLTRFGFAPLPGSNGKRAIEVEVSAGLEGGVILFSPECNKRLAAGFSATEMRSQRLVIAKGPSEPRGTAVHIRTQYAPPVAERLEGLGGLASALHDRLHLHAAQGSSETPLKPALRAEILRILTGEIVASRSGSSPGKPVPFSEATRRPSYVPV